ncbi:hypothetical protein AB4254_08260 [Vibrio breoganii]
MDLVKVGLAVLALYCVMRGTRDVQSRVFLCVAFLVMAMFSFVVGAELALPKPAGWSFLLDDAQGYLWGLAIEGGSIGLAVLLGLCALVIKDLWRALNQVN